MNPIPLAGKFDVYKTMLFPYAATSILGRYWEEDAKEMMKVMAPEMSIEYHGHQYKLNARATNMAMSEDVDAVNNAQVLFLEMDGIW